MSQPTITAEDEARYMQIMGDYDDMMRNLDPGPVPMCHFTPMEFHGDDSGSGGDGYQCVHCGHSELAEDAWEKVYARTAKPRDCA